MEFFVLEYNERSKVNYNYFAVTDLSNALGQTCIYSEAKASRRTIAKEHPMYI